MFYIENSGIPKGFLRNNNFKIDIRRTFSTTIQFIFPRLTSGVKSSF